jgi:hypothetical protein
VAAVSGDVVQTSKRLSYDAFGNGTIRFHRDANGQPLQENTVTTGDASDLFKTSPVLLADAQVAVSVNVTETLKLRASGGVSLPGYHPISLSFVYFFGR